MWNDIAAGFALFESTAVFSIVGILLFSLIGLTLIRYGRWQSPAIYAFGLFGSARGAKLVALALILLRCLFFDSCAFTAPDLQPPLICYGVLLTVGIVLLLEDVRFIPIDALSVAAAFSTLYAQYRIRDYMSTLQDKAPVRVLLISVGLLTVLLSLVMGFRGLEYLTESPRKYTANSTPFLKKLPVRQFILLLSTGLLMLLLTALLGRAGTLFLQGRLFQYASGKIVSYSGSFSVKRTDSVCTLQKIGEKPQKLLTGPLYYEGKNEILLSQDFIIVQPKLFAVNRLPSMSRVSRANQKFYVQTDSGTATVSDFFLYDGKSTYLFFEPVTLKWGNRSVAVSPFSTISVQYGHSLDIFDRQKKKSSQLDTGMDDVMVTMQCQAKINLSSDILYGTDGREQMLFIQPVLLKDFQP